MKAVPFEREQRQVCTNFLRKAIFNLSPLVLHPYLSPQLFFVSVFLTTSRNLSLLLLFHSPFSYLFFLQILLLIKEILFPSWSSPDLFPD